MYGVDMFIIELLSMFHMSSSSRSLITTVMHKLRFFNHDRRTVTRILVYLNKRCIIFESLLNYVISGSDSVASITEVLIFRASSIS